MTTFPDPNSIVDYLKTQNSDSSLGARGDLFKRAGLEGDFSGTAQQNTDLMSALKGNSALLGSDTQQTTSITNNTRSLRREATDNASRLDLELEALANGQNQVSRDGDQTNQPNVAGDPAQDKFFTADRLGDREADIGAEFDPQMAQMESTFNSLQATATAATNNLIQNIRDKYALRQIQQEDINKRQLGGGQKLASKSGRARYLPQESQGILSDIETKGIQKLAELDAQEAGLLAQAEQARTKDDLAILNSRMTQLDNIRDQKQEALKTLFEAANAEEQAILDRQQEKRVQEKQSFDMAGELAGKIAPAMFEEFEKLDTAGQVSLVKQIAEARGIDPLLILGAFAEYTDTQTKAGLDAQKTQATLDNIASQIQDRGARQDLAERKETRLRQEADLPETGEVGDYQYDGFTEIKSSLDNAFEFGLEEYAGRDAKGDIPVSTYEAAYKSMLEDHDEYAALDFLNTYPPSENISPTRKERKALPDAIQNRL